MEAPQDFSIPAAGRTPLNLSFSGVGPWFQSGSNLFFPLTLVKVSLSTPPEAERNESLILSSTFTSQLNKRHYSMQLLEVVIFIEMKNFFPPGTRETLDICWRKWKYFMEQFIEATFSLETILHQIIQSQFISRSETLDRLKKKKKRGPHAQNLFLNKLSCKLWLSLMEKQLPGPAIPAVRARPGDCRQHKLLWTHLDSNCTLWPCGNHFISISSFIFFFISISSFFHFYEEEDVHFPINLFQRGGGQLRLANLSEVTNLFWSSCVFLKRCHFHKSTSKQLMAPGNLTWTLIRLPDWNKSDLRKYKWVVSISNINPHCAWGEFSQHQWWWCIAGPLQLAAL